MDAVHSETNGSRGGHGSRIVIAGFALAAVALLCWLAVRVSWPSDRAEEHRTLGDRFLDAGDPVRAISEYTSAIELDPSAASIYNDRGIAHFSAGSMDLAIADYTAAIELSPVFARAYNNRGFARMVQGDDIALAMRDYSRAIEVDSSYGNAYINRGTAFYLMRKLDQAAVDFNAAIASGRSAPKGYVWLSCVHRTKGDLASAEAALDKAIGLDPTFTEAYVHRGSIHELKGDRELAARDYQTALDLEPAPMNRPWAQEGLARVQSLTSSARGVITEGPFVAVAGPDRSRPVGNTGPPSSGGMLWRDAQLPSTCPAEKPDLPGGIRGTPTSASGDSH